MRLVGDIFAILGTVFYYFIYLFNDNLATGGGWCNLVVSRRDFKTQRKKNSKNHKGNGKTNTLYHWNLLQHFRNLSTVLNTAYEIEVDASGTLIDIIARDRHEQKIQKYNRKARISHNDAQGHADVVKIYYKT